MFISVLQFCIILNNANYFHLLLFFIFNPLYVRKFGKHKMQFVYIKNSLNFPFNDVKQFIFCEIKLSLKFHE